MSYKYNPESIEKKWQTRWEEEKTFKTLDASSEKPKYYILDMFPYPSGSGLHVGHPEGYTATDIIARYKRMQGFNVLHPMGWDAFGLPAERAAVRENKHPSEITRENIANFKKQIKRLGLSYDWSREICTSDPKYYRWTQWIFLQMVQKNLAYLAEVPVNWCPNQGTVLANEEVVDGKYVETGDPVEQKNMRQWMLKITDYAERLLNDLEDLDWPENVIEMQKNWIGKSQGANIDFKVDGHNEKITVFTTKPETIYGATFVVVAPNHPLLKKVTKEHKKEQVEHYCEQITMGEEHQEKTGIDTGAMCINPMTGKKIPIWVADYVKLDYGTGAIMAVPAHDERDKDFAEKFNLNIITVIDSDDHMVNSKDLNGMEVKKAHLEILKVIETEKLGEIKTMYKLRDWLFSRQRYWGEPFPMIYDQKDAPHPLPESDLPVLLPEIENFKPTADGKPPLGRATNAWKEVFFDGQICTRELNTMPQWAGSCWYYLRYMDPHNTQEPFDKKTEAYWGQVDLYVGGLEHAVSHLLYARFWHKVLYDIGLVSHKEPFKKLFNQGMILGISYRDSNGKYYHSKDIVHQGDQVFSKVGNKKLTAMVEKMSKSKLNVVNPDDVVNAYGADALRLYEMFMGPLEATKPWQSDGVKGVYSFLQRVWVFSIDSDHGGISNNLNHSITLQENSKLYRLLNQLIEKVTYDIEHLKFNTSIAKMMEFVNACRAEKQISQALWSKFILLLSPFAPHIAEEIWQILGHQKPLAYEKWPSADQDAMKSEYCEMTLCINGKKINTLDVAINIDEAEAKSLFENDEKVKKAIEGKRIKKIIVVKNKLINAVVI